MTDIKSSKTKESVESRISEEMVETFNNVTNSKSKMYYLSLVLLNLFTIVLASFWFISNDNIVTFKEFSENVTFQNILLLVAIFLIVMALYALPMSLRLYCRTKNMKFFTMYKINAMSKFYGNFSIYAKNEDVCTISSLRKCKVNEKNAISIAYGCKHSENIAKALYYFIFLAIGTFLYVDIMANAQAASHAGSINLMPAATLT